LVQFDGAKAMAQQVGDEAALDEIGQRMAEITGDGAAS
jgi:hypothetical protein